MIKSLIYKSDIKKIEQKAKTQNLTFNELSLVKDSKLSEQQIQSNCKTHIDGLNKELSLKKLGKVKFVQIDNGGKLTRNGRMAKGRQGTISGFPDVMILCYSKKRKENDTIFLEFKRIGTKSQIKIKENQIKQIEELKSMKFFSGFINNSLYFEKCVCLSIKEFMECDE